MFSKGKGVGTEELVWGEGSALAGYWTASFIFDTVFNLEIANCKVSEFVLLAIFAWILLFQ